MTAKGILAVLAVAVVLSIGMQMVSGRVINAIDHKIDRVIDSYAVRY